MNTALLIIDIQKDYFPGGKFPLVEPVTAAKKAYMLLQCFREHGGHHVHIQHVSLNPDAAFFISGDRGTDIRDEVAHFEGEPPAQLSLPPPTADPVPVASLLVPPATADWRPLAVLSRPPAT